MMQKSVQPCHSSCHCLTLLPLLCRIRFDYSECLVGPSNTQILEHGIAELAKRYEMEWRIFYDRKVKRVAILVSKLDHCLYDLLIRFKSGELSCQIPVIISNHPNLAGIAEQFGVAFRFAQLMHCTLLLDSLVISAQQCFAILQMAQTNDGLHHVALALLKILPDSA